ncbi:MAG: phospholipid-binding protein MlaC [Candidatus Eiseniibacteriota bacterium]
MRRHPLTPLLAVLVLGIAIGMPAADVRADDAADARSIVQTIADQGLDIVKRPNKNERYQAFLELFKQKFDTVAIGRFVLGQYRRDIDPAQFDRFSAVFQELVARTYTTQLGQYAGEQFKVQNARADGKRWIVESRVVPPGRSSIKLDWILGKTKEGLKVLDVRVDNLSMAITQRDEFASVLQQNAGNVDKLIAFMQDKIKRLDAGT